MENGKEGTAGRTRARTRVEAKDSRDMARGAEERASTQWTAAGGTSDWDGYDMVSIVSCSKDDAILSNHGSNSNFHGGNYAHFSGYLIG